MVHVEGTHPLAEMWPQLVNTFCQLPATSRQHCKPCTHMLVMQLCISLLSASTFQSQEMCL